MSEPIISRRGGARPGAGRPGWDTPAERVYLPPDVAQQLLTLTQTRRAETGDRKLSQTAVVCDLIAAAFANLALDTGPESPYTPR